MSVTLSQSLQEANRRGEGQQLNGKKHEIDKNIQPNLGLCYFFFLIFWFYRHFSFEDFCQVMVFIEIVKPLSLKVSCYTSICRKKKKEALKCSRSPCRHKWKWQIAGVWHPWWSWSYKTGLLHFNLQVIFWSSQFFETLISWSKNVPFFLTTSEMKFHFSRVILGKKHEFFCVLMVNKGNAIPPISQIQKELEGFYLNCETKQK